MLGSLDRLTDRLSEQLKPYPPSVTRFYTNLYRELCCSHAYT